jgi:hypothetical protein
MSYCRYSPFVFETVEQVAEPKKQVVKEKRHLHAAAAKHRSETRDLGCTMPIEEAHSISSLPTAFVSPNGPDVRRMSKSIFGF